MLLILNPWALVHLLVRVGHRAFAVFPSFLELTSVNLAVLPDFRAETIHICILEIARVRLLEISEIISPVAFKDAVDKITLIVTTIGPFVEPCSVLFAFFEYSSVL